MNGLFRTTGLPLLRCSEPFVLKNLCFNLKFSSGSESTRPEWKELATANLQVITEHIMLVLSRVLAICFPMRYQITSRRARLMILLIWIVALTTTIPWPVYFHLVSVIPGRPEIKFCLEEWPSERDKDIYFIINNVVFCYLLPLVLILICYVMIWVRVSSRSIPTETQGAHLDRMHQRSKVRV